MTDLSPAPLEGLEKVHAKFGHLREQKRQADVEQRGGAEVADIGIN